MFFRFEILSTAYRRLSEGVPGVDPKGTRWDSMLWAVDGVADLKNIIHAAERRIEVVIGGGISAETASHLFEKLPKEGVSVHAYSSVRSGGVTDSLKVRQLVDAVSRFESGSSG